MNHLNSEFIASLNYRHRNDDGLADYLTYFYFQHPHEPFPIFPLKPITVHEAIDRFTLHNLDQLKQNRPLLFMGSTVRWITKSTFDYINSQLRLLLPQNFKTIIIDLSDVEASSRGILRTVMNEVGISHIVKNDKENLKNFKRYIQFQWSEYKKKFYLIFFRSDNLSFSQLKFLRELLVPDKMSAPLVYILLEGIIDTYHKIRDLRKDSIDDLVYNTLFVLHSGSLDTVMRNLEQKLGKSIDQLISPVFFEQLFFEVNGSPIYPLVHSILHRMMGRGIKKLEQHEIFHEIFSEIQKENDEFVARSPEYKKKLEKKDYIFPPELLRDGPSITEARRFFRWMRWEE